MEKNLKEEINELLGVPKPIYHECIIAISENGQGVLLKSFPNLFNNELFESCLLEDNLTNIKNIPTEVGLYTCKIKVYSFPCNHIADPKEWDITVSACEIEKMPILL